MDRNLQILGIANKAGLLAVGGDAVSIAARTGRAKLIISAIDASEGAQRRAAINAKNSRVVHIAVPYTKYELSDVTRRGSPGTVAVLDAGLAARFAQGLAAECPDKYGDASELLAGEAGKQKEKRKHIVSGKRRAAQ